MTRYFYTDPLAAAWMAKHFEMRFTNGSADNHEVMRSYPSLFELDDGLNRYEYNGKYYIHPDSVYLLKPRKGDRLLWRGYGRTEWKYEEAYYHTEMKGWDFLILQRNNIPFMWSDHEY